MSNQNDALLISEQVLRGIYHARHRAMMESCTGEIEVVVVLSNEDCCQLRSVAHYPHVRREGRSLRFADHRILIDGGLKPGEMEFLVKIL